MIHYDHALLGATFAVAAGAHRRHGWPLVAAVALGSMLPDWDSLSGTYGPDAHRAVHRVCGHNLWAAVADTLARAQAATAPKKQAGKEECLPQPRTEMRRLP